MGQLDKAASRQGGGSDVATVETGDRDPTKGEAKKKKKVHQRKGMGEGRGKN
jgi:hypothetical protein